MSVRLRQVFGFRSCLGCGRKGRLVNEDSLALPRLDLTRPFEAKLVTAGLLESGVQIARITMGPLRCLDCKGTNGINSRRQSMNRMMWVVAFVVVAFTGATLAAQTSGTPSSQSSSGTITLTGCLQKGSASGGTTGTSGTGSTSSTSGTSSSSSSSGGQFVLTNAQMGSGSSSRSTSGTSG